MLFFLSSYGLIGGFEVLVKCVTFESFPVHEINLHQVSTCRGEVIPLDIMCKL